MVPLGELVFATRDPYVRGLAALYVDAAIVGDDRLFDRLHGVALENAFPIEFSGDDLCHR